MNILLINYEYPPVGAGAATATWHLAREMGRLGHRAVVLASAFRHHRGRSVEDGVVVYRVRSLRRAADHSSVVEMAAFVVSASLSILPVIRRESIDRCIAFFSIPGGPVALLAHLLRGVPYVIALRGGDVPGNEPHLAAVHRILTPLRRMVLRHASAIVANSHGLKAVAEKADPFPVAVIPNGVDTEFFRPVRNAEYGMRSEEPKFVSGGNSTQTAPSQSTGPLRAEGKENQHASLSALRTPHSQLPFRFLFVGRFQPQKNLFFLLKQMDLLARETEVPFELHLVGDGPDGNRLKEFAQSLASNDIIKWHPWCGREDLLGHYQAADCFVNLSTYEGMPNTVLEAMACGLPVIASKVPGNEELVRDGETGWLVEIESSDCPRQLLRGARLVTRPADGTMASRCREKAVSLSWGRSARAHLDIIGQ